MAKSYEYSIGSVRVKETSLFTNAEVEQMLGFTDEAQLVSYLVDKGYGKGDTTEEVLRDSTAKMWDYIKSVAPDFSVFNPFFYLNDIHNLKAILKGTMSGRDCTRLLLSPYTIDFGTLKGAVENRKFSLLPQWLSKEADEAYEILAHTKDARLSDAILDKAVMKKILEAGEKSGSLFLRDYFRTVVFYSNIKIALRSAKIGATEDFLKRALCEVPEFPMTTVVKAAQKGIDNLVDTLAKFSAYELQKAMEAYRISPTAFERFVDNKLISAAKEVCKRASSGCEPLLGYYLGCEAQNKVIHIVASGLRTKTDKETIRERLREIYG
ncbi:MAG: V-type ATPase subunit [Eubacteriales bacterium]|nr:V-type ATPase subunit [Eubacteriales bacterium]